VPNRLTQYISPATDDTMIAPSLGLFVQDQWSVSRVTLKGGIRYEYHRAFANEINAPAGQLGPPAATFPKADCLPCWHDITPRMAVAWDMFGNGRTAVKFSLDKYVAAITTGLAGNYGPASARVTNTTRRWTDSDLDFFPDCDLANPLANLECGQMANTSWGQSVPRAFADPDWITGWGKRPYNWSTSISVDHQLRPGVALNAGYYHRWYGNFSVLDNTLVTPADYDPYCITAPVDARLGDVSGQQICGLYDIKPEKFGSSSTNESHSSNFGKQSETFDGVDANFTVRIPGGATLAGGWNMGNSVNTASTGSQIGITLGTNSKTKACFVVDSPQALYNCESGNPFQHRFKFNGSYPFPYGIQVAAVYQYLPGPNYGASLVVPTAAIAPSLGRNLAGGTANATIELLVPGSEFIDERTNQLDVRFTKILNTALGKIQANFDLYNVFNNNAVLNVISTYGPQWLRPTQILDARLAKFSFQIDF
jgi:hypothetical protein